MKPTQAETKAYLERRMAEEAAKAKGSACLVRAAHEEFADEYKHALTVIDEETTE